MSLNPFVWQFLGLFCLSTLFSGTASCQERQNHRWISLASENDFLGLGITSDNYYSFGDRLDFLQRLNQKDEETNRFFNFRFTLEGHTPKYAGKLQEEKYRRPFFGWMHWNLMILKSSESHFLQYGLDLGISGPAARAGAIQNWYHTHVFIDNNKVDGWQNQTPNKFGAQLVMDYKRFLATSEQQRLGLGMESSVGNMFSCISPSLTYQYTVGSNNYLPFNYSQNQADKFVLEGQLKYSYEFHNAALQGEYFSDASYLSDDVVINSIFTATIGARYTRNHLSLYFNNTFNTKRVKNNEWHLVGMLGLVFHL